MIQCCTQLNMSTFGAYLCNWLHLVVIVIAGFVDVFAIGVDKMIIYVILCSVTINREVLWFYNLIYWQSIQVNNDH